MLFIFIRPLEVDNKADEGVPVVIGPDVRSPGEADLDVAGPSPKRPHLDEDDESVADSEEEEWMTELHDCVSRILLLILKRGVLFRPK